MSKTRPEGEKRVERIIHTDFADHIDLSFSDENEVF